MGLESARPWGCSEAGVTAGIKEMTGILSSPSLSTCWMPLRFFIRLSLCWDKIVAQEPTSRPSLFKSVGKCAPSPSSSCWLPGLAWLWCPALSPSLRLRTGKGLAWAWACDFCRDLEYGATMLLGVALQTNARICWCRKQIPCKPPSPYTLPLVPERHPTRMREWQFHAHQQFWNESCCSKSTPRRGQPHIPMSSQNRKLSWLTPHPSSACLWC